MIDVDSVCDIQFPPISSTTLYSVIALKHLDSTAVVNQTLRIKKIPRAIKGAIYITYIKNLWLYGFANCANKQDDYIRIPLIILLSFYSKKAVTEMIACKNYTLLHT